MEPKIKGFFTHLLEAAAMFALAMFLFQVGVCYLSHIWWVLLIIAVMAIAGVAAWRFWRSKQNNQW